jgi:hypothetical protein
MIFGGRDDEFVIENSFPIAVLKPLFVVLILLVLHLLLWTLPSVPLTEVGVPKLTKFPAVAVTPAAAVPAELVVPLALVKLHEANKAAFAVPADIAKAINKPKTLTISHPSKFSKSTPNICFQWKLLPFDTTPRRPQ